MFTMGRVVWCIADDWSICWLTVGWLISHVMIARWLSVLCWLSVGQVLTKMSLVVYQLSVNGSSVKCQWIIGQVSGECQSSFDCTLIKCGCARLFKCCSNFSGIIIVFPTSEKMLFLGTFCCKLICLYDLYCEKGSLILLLKGRTNLEIFLETCSCTKTKYFKILLHKYVCHKNAIICWEMLV